MMILLLILLLILLHFFSMILFIFGLSIILPIVCEILFLVLQFFLYRMETYKKSKKRDVGLGIIVFAISFLISEYVIFEMQIKGLEISTIELMFLQAWKFTPITLARDHLSILKKDM